MKKMPAVCALDQYPMSYSMREIRSALMMNAKILEEVLYKDGKKIEDAYKDDLYDQCNFLKLDEIGNIKYGISVRRCNLRALPTDDALFSSAEDVDFDALQETAIDPSEPVVILHQSKDKSFYYVQTYHSQGWIAGKDIAKIYERNTWLRYVNLKYFLVVTDKRFNLRVNGETLLYQMGSRIKIQSTMNDKVYGNIPTRKEDGYLKEVVICIEPSSAIHKGYLMYTRDNLLVQSFKFLGELYGWGGLKDSVDCSSMVQNIYRTVGIRLPRNSGAQEQTAGIHYNMQGAGRKERYDLIKKLAPGDTLHMKGHVMIYLGTVESIPYVIHSLGSHTLHFKNGSLKKIPIMRVVVSDLTLKRYTGVAFIDDLTTAVSFH